MKKNILTVVIMAACVINLVLNIVLVFSVMPAMNKTGTLVDKVASVIDLEIESQDEDQEYTMEDLVPYEKAYESNQTLKLKADAGDEKDHFALLTGWTISFNSKADDFGDIQTQITTNDVYVDNIVQETIKAYTISTLDETKVCQEIVQKIREKYNTKAVVEASLTGLLPT